MYGSQVTFIAVDIVAERTRDAERHARLFAGAGPDFAGPGRIRRDLARIAAAVSRQSAELARRLDSSVA